MSFVASLRGNGLLRAASLLAVCLLTGSGCQTWSTSSALPGLAAKQNERKVLQEAKNDPFPSPSDVGLEGSN